MISPHLIADLRRAERIFMRSAQPILANTCRRLRGDMCDAINPIQAEAEAKRLINLASPNIHA